MGNQMAMEQCNPTIKELAAYIIKNASDDIATTTLKCTSHSVKDFWSHILHIVRAMEVC